MRTLNRNKQNIYYSLFLGTKDKVDSDGYHTGEKEVLYSPIESEKVNVSSARGEQSIELFGSELNYSKTIITEKKLGWDEQTRLWLDDAMENELFPSNSLFPSDSLFPNNISKPHNYTVVAVAKSLNNFAYAIRKVDVENN